VKNIQQAGSAFQPSFEKILMLKTDFILGREYQKNISHQLRNFAPTVLVDWEDFTSFKDNFRYIAQLLGEEKQAEKAGKDKQVYIVNQGDWFAGGPLGVNKIIDDLFKYLVK
jgi:ABC-type Fe3+-hydroxamate transport system substrate-binding protein